MPSPRLRSSLFHLSSCRARGDQSFTPPRTHCYHPAPPCLRCLTPLFATLPSAIRTQVVTDSPSTTDTASILHCHACTAPPPSEAHHSCRLHTGGDRPALHHGHRLHPAWPARAAGAPPQRERLPALLLRLPYPLIGCFIGRCTGSIEINACKIDASECDWVAASVLQSLLHVDSGG